jgi:hypothetical protein
MAETKTKPTGADVKQFLASIDDERVRDDCSTIAAMMRRATGAKPRMWGSNMVGYGTYTMRYANGKEGTWMLTAFAPRKRRITLYLMSGFEGFDSLITKLGKHTKGKSCLHIGRLSDVHAPTLEKLIVGSVKAMKRTYKTTTED